MWIISFRLNLCIHTVCMVVCITGQHSSMSIASILIKSLSFAKYFESLSCRMGEMAGRMGAFHQVNLFVLSAFHKLLHFASSRVQRFQTFSLFADNNVPMQRSEVEARGTAANIYGRAKKSSISGGSCQRGKAC